MDQVPAIRTTGLTKDYGGGHGLFELDLEVRRGEVFGYIGPNGAGKTTTIRLLMDLVRPDRGRAEVFGLDCHERSVEVKRITGYLPGELPDLGGATGEEVLGLLASLRGGVDRKRRQELAATLQLDLTRRYRDYSHGNKQKLLLVQAFMHEPKVLLLDEPTLGLDPVVQQSFRRIVHEAADRGATVFLSSHVLSEVEQDCDRIAVLWDGRLREVGSMAELRHLTTHRVDAVLERDPDLKALEATEGVSALTLDDHHLRCSVQGAMSSFLAALEPAGIVELDSQELSLEELFLAEYAKR